MSYAGKHAGGRHRRRTRHSLTLLMAVAVAGGVASTALTMHERPASSGAEPGQRSVALSVITSPTPDEQAGPQQVATDAGVPDVVSTPSPARPTPPAEQHQQTRQVPRTSPSTRGAPAAFTSPRPAVSQQSAAASIGTCQASYYDLPSGTASGERYSADKLTAAHKTLPFGTRVRVTNLANGKQVTVRINDRGPYITGRCLDLSVTAFATVASLGSGVISVRYEILG